MNIILSTLLCLIVGVGGISRGLVLLEIIHKMGGSLLIDFGLIFPKTPAGFGTSSAKFPKMGGSLLNAIGVIFFQKLQYDPPYN